MLSLHWGVKCNSTQIFNWYDPRNKISYWWLCLVPSCAHLSPLPQHCPAPPSLANKAATHHQGGHCHQIILSAKLSPTPSKLPDSILDIILIGIWPICTWSWFGLSNKIWNYFFFRIISVDKFYKRLLKGKEKLLNKYILLPNINFRQTNNK